MRALARLPYPSLVARTLPPWGHVGARSSSIEMGRVAACSEDDEIERCAGRELRHEGDPTTCIAWYGLCHRCGVQQGAPIGGYGVGAVTVPLFEEELPPIGAWQSETFQRPS